MRGLRRTSAKFAAAAALIVMAFAWLVFWRAGEVRAVNITANVRGICGNNVRDWNEACDGSDLNNLSCASFGFASGTLACAASCDEFNTSACTSVAGTIVTSTVPVASATTTVTIANGSGTASLAFPQNYYTEDLSLNAFSYDNRHFIADKPEPSGQSFVGKTYDFNLYNYYGTKVIAVTKAVNIALSYGSSDISGIDENTLVPYRWGSGDSSWQIIPGAIIDKTNKKVIFSTAFFSSFALFGRPPAPVLPPSGGGGGGGGGAIPPAEIKRALLAADFDGDGRVDMKDFSIMLYYFGLPNPPARYDLDSDGVVNLTDISILLYYWKP